MIEPGTPLPLSVTESAPVPEIQHLFDVIGADGFTRLVDEFYERVQQDEVLAPMYPQDDWDGARERLTLFLIQRFGGPTTYSERRGHPRLRMRHAPYRIDRDARARWLTHMRAAIVATGVPPMAAAELEGTFDSVATMLLNTPG